jgi:hypothetical protein
MGGLVIVGASVLASVVFGLIHDQVTIRVCPEYFTVFHPAVAPAGTSLTVLALIWGVIATWWMGAFLGVILAVAARGGRRPKVEPRALLRPITRLLGVMGLLALGFGVLGYLAAEAGWIRMLPNWAEEIPAERHSGFLADLWAHNASYASGLIGGLWLCWRTWLGRGRAGEQTAGAGASGG